MMKDKIKIAIQNEFQNLGLGTKTIDGAVAFLEPSITAETTDEQLIAAVKSIGGMLKSFQSEADVIRQAKSAAEKKAMELEEKMKGQALPVTKSQPIEIPINTTDFIAELKQAAADEIARIKAENEAYRSSLQMERRTAFVKSEAKRLDIPEALMSNMSFDAALDDASVTQKLTDIKQVLVNNSIQTSVAPVLTRSEVSTDEIAEIMRHIK